MSVPSRSPGERAATDHRLDPLVVAEVEALAAAVGQPAEHGWEQRFQVLSSFAQRYLEYQIDLDGGPVNLITLGEGAGFLDAVATSLVASGVSEECRRTFDLIRRLAPEATWGFKLSTGVDAAPQVYARAPIGVEEALFWVRRRAGLGEQACESIRDIATILAKNHLHFLAADLAQPAPRFQVYFTQFLEDGSPALERVEAITAIAGLPTTQVPAIKELHGVLAQAQATMWLSVGFGNHELLPGLKLDYADVRLGTAAIAVEDCVDFEASLDRLDALRVVLGCGRCDVFGVRFGPDRAPSMTAYVTRRRSLF